MKFLLSSTGVSATAATGFFRQDSDWVIASATSSTSLPVDALQEQIRDEKHWNTAWLSEREVCRFEVDPYNPFNCGDFCSLCLKRCFFSSEVKNSHHPIPIAIPASPVLEHGWLEISERNLVGGFNHLPLWKIWRIVSWDDEIPNIWKKTCSKPPIYVNGGLVFWNHQLWEISSKPRRNYWRVTASYDVYIYIHDDHYTSPFMDKDSRWFKCYKLPI